MSTEKPGLKDRVKDAKSKDVKADALQEMG
jgi:hypothetical protein